MGFHDGSLASQRPHRRRFRRARSASTAAPPSHRGVFAQGAPLCGAARPKPGSAPHGTAKGRSYRLHHLAVFAGLAPHRPIDPLGLPQWALGPAGPVGSTDSGRSNPYAPLLTSALGGCNLGGDQRQSCSRRLRWPAHGFRLQGAGVRGREALQESPASSAWRRASGTSQKGVCLVSLSSPAA